MPGGNCLQTHQVGIAEFRLIEWHFSSDEGDDLLAAVEEVPRRKMADISALGKEHPAIANRRYGKAWMQPEAHVSVELRLFIGKEEFCAAPPPTRRSAARNP